MIIAIAREVGDTTTRRATGCRAVEAVGGRRNGMCCRGWRGLGLTEHRCVDGLSMEEVESGRIESIGLGLGVFGVGLLNHPL